MMVSTTNGRNYTFAIGVTSGIVLEYEIKKYL